MLTTAEATSAILAAVPRLEPESVALEQSAGRVLRQKVIAERDQPPFDRVMMDGIAISHADYDSGRRAFEIQGLQAAGDEAGSLQPGKAIEIMTGASLPAGADCVIPVERIAVEDGVATVEADYETTARQFVHPRGSDHRQGTELLRQGTRLSPLDVAIVASAGLARVAVSRQPSIRVISTGNELVPAGAPIAPHQIRLSNGPALTAMLAEHGCEHAEHDHLRDDPALLERRIGGHLDASDVLVLSGGVSMGKADYIPGVLQRLGVKRLFHTISQRPGKPMWFGIGRDGQAVFALPGNPVSALVCCRQYVVPALAHMAGLRPTVPQFAALAQPVTFRPRLTNFLPARLASSTSGQVLAIPVHTNTSGDFASLAGTDGYVELALEQTEFPAGTSVPLHRWRV